MKQYLYETFTFKPVSINETTGENGRMVVEGVFQRADVLNANRRKYPRKLWERILHDPGVESSLKERRMFGELDHPQDGKSLLQRTSHLITSLRMQEDGTILGRAEIFDTPNGKTLQEVIRAGSMPGISSRGSGSVRRVDGYDVVQEDFILETFDFVSNPSTPGAYPRPVHEEALAEQQSDTTKEKPMGLEKFRILEDRANTVLGVKAKSLDENTRRLAEQNATELVVEVRKVAAESPEVKDLAEALIERLAKKRQTFVEAAEAQHDEKPAEKPAPVAAPIVEAKADDKKPVVAEDTKPAKTVWPEMGWLRSVPVEAEPGPGEGWPVDPSDEGVLTGINNGKNAWHEAKSKQKGGAEMGIFEDDEEDEKKKKKHDDEVSEAFGKDDDEDDDDEDKKEKNESRERALKGFAKAILKTPVSESTPANHPARIMAEAFLLQRRQRRVENQAFRRVIGRMQERLQEAVRTGSLKVGAGNAELEEKYNLATEVIKDLTQRYKAQSARFYAEEALYKAGLKDNQDARQAVAEAMKKSLTKKSIDEAIAILAPIRGTQVTRTSKSEMPVPMTESADLPLRGKALNLEGQVSKLAEDKKRKNAPLSGADLGDRLAESMSTARSR